MASDLFNAARRVSMHTGAQIVFVVTVSGYPGTVEASCYSEDDQEAPQAERMCDHIKMAAETALADWEGRIIE